MDVANAELDQRKTSDAEQQAGADGLPTAARARPGEVVLRGLTELFRAAIVGAIAMGSIAAVSSAWTVGEGHQR